MATRSEFNQQDSDIERDRGTRLVVAITSPIIMFLLCYRIGMWVTVFFKIPLAGVLGMSLGLGLGALGVLWLIPRLFVVNNAVAAFVTVDLLTNKLVSYGTGFHWSFPWEKRDGANNVNLDEASESFEFTVQMKSGGTLKGKGSFRLRPDVWRLPQFLAGVASVASELSDLIKAAYTKRLAKLELMRGLDEMSVVNDEVSKEFMHGGTQTPEVSGFEERFGVIIGDVTLSELLPSAEVQKALDGASENAAMEAIVLRNLGYATMEEVRTAITTGKLTNDQLTSATHTALAMTDNLHGMKVDHSNITLRVVADDKTAEALAAVGPALAKGLALMGGNKSVATPKKGGK